jgi:branched-chain amino acid transport system permease protein
VTPTARRRRRAAVWLVLAVVLALLPLVTPRYPRFVLSLALLNAIAAMGVNLSMGYAGLVSVGHAGFAGVGAYTTALLIQHAGLAYWPALAAGALAAAMVGVVIGIPALRLNPLYISVVTFGFGQVVTYLALNWVGLTNGPNGIAVAPAELGPYMFSPETFYFPVAAAFLLLLWTAANIVRSRFGRSLVAIRDGVLAAQAMGVDVARYKVLAFALGAFYGGVSGGLYAGLSEFINPDAFIFPVSILYLTMNVVGGMGTVPGPVIGAFVFTILPELLRPFAEYKEFISGGLLLAFLVFRPKGLMSLRHGVRWRPPAPLAARTTREP